MKVDDQQSRERLLPRQLYVWRSMKFEAFSADTRRTEHLMDHAPSTEPGATTLATIRQHLTADEQLCLARMIEVHGEAAVIEMWPSLQVQIEFARE